MSFARPTAVRLVFLFLSVVQLVAAAAIGAEDRPATAVSNPVAAQSLDRLSTTLERPLFSPSRHPPAPPPPPAVEAAAPPAPPPSPPNLLLFGVVMDGEGARALIRASADKKIQRAQIGVGYFALVVGLVGLDQLGRTFQAADMVGAIRR